MTISILGPAQSMPDDARVWAEAREAHERFGGVVPLLYATASRYRVRPEVAVALAAHETDFGWFDGVVPASWHNWGGLKVPQGGSNDDPEAHQRFPDDRTGVLAVVQHLARYAGATSAMPGDAVVDPRWGAVAPGSAPTVAALSNHWAGPDYGQHVATLVIDLLAFAATRRAGVVVTLREDVVPAGIPNRPRLPMDPHWITVHETANTNAGADAAMHRQFVAGGGGDEGVSFHWAVDDHEAVHIIPDDEAAWHAGDGYDGPGNRDSVAIETCVNADGDWARTRENLAQLVVWLMNRHTIALDHVVQHNHWSGKDCPHTLRASGQWGNLLQRATLMSQGGDATRRDPITDKLIGGGFRLFLEDLERKLGASDTLLLIGRPLTEELVEDGLTVQYFERAVFEWHGGARPPFDVILRRLGADALARRGGA